MKLKLSHLPLVYLLVSFLGHLTGFLLPPSSEVYGAGATIYEEIKNIGDFLAWSLVLPFGQVLSIFGGMYFSLASIVTVVSGICFMKTKKAKFLLLFSLFLFFISTRALYFFAMAMSV